MTRTMPFFCTICEEESTRICVSCTKDTCGNHLCERCGSCSDCCSCELSLDPHEETVASLVRHAEPAAAVAEVEIADVEDDLREERGW